MLLHVANDETLCRAFSTTLKKVARQWFSSLPPRSVGSFEQLGRLFITYFISSQRQRRTLDMLIGIKQRESESLQEFISRFNAATLEVSDLDPMVAMSTMKGGLKPSRFLFSLEKRFSASFTKMLFRAEKYVNAEEVIVARKDAAPSQPEGREKRRRKTPTDEGRLT